MGRFDGLIWFKLAQRTQSSLSRPDGHDLVRSDLTSPIWSELIRHTWSNSSLFDRPDRPKAIWAGLTCPIQSMSVQQTRSRLSWLDPVQRARSNLNQFDGFNLVQANLAGLIRSKPPWRTQSDLSQLNELNRSNLSGPILFWLWFQVFPNYNRTGPWVQLKLGSAWL